MQVSHATDHITHVVIGGKKTIDFGISDSPEFFAILSSALYKHPMLAMVRETICNAWDAHIDAGLNQKAIKITLDDEYLIIQDFGKGIPDALIGPIYGVYGASTKKNDGRQTGGFGLGCKSPFAYTDHFEVTSCHGGVKAIYNMSKSSAEMNGKPGIVPIASFPTTETGVTVKIPLNPTKANSKLDGLIRQVVYNGDIKAQYNSSELPILGLDTSEQGMVMLPVNHNNTQAAPHISSRINVRYGNVIYPVEEATEYRNLYQQVNGLLSSHYNCRLVITAPADSLSITPSREALTLTDITANTINNLLAKFLAVFMRNQQMVKRHQELIHEYVDAAATEHGDLLQKLPLGDWAIPGIPDTVTGDVLSTLEEFAKLEVTLRASNRRKAVKAKIWLKFIQQYFYKINEKELFSQGLFQSWVRTFQKKMKTMTSPERARYDALHLHGDIATAWWRKKILAPMVQNLSTFIPNFDRKKLYYSSFHMNKTEYYGVAVPQQVGKVKVTNHTHNLIHLITPTVILTHAANVIPKRIQGYNRKEQMGSSGTFLKDTYFVYEVSRKQEELLAMREAFKNVPGIEFIDLTERLPNEQLAYEERKALIAKERIDRAAGHVPKTRLIKKVKAGMVRLDTLLEGQTWRIDNKLFSSNVDPEKILEPEAVTLISLGQDKSNNLQGMNDTTSFAVAKLYGDKVGISNKTDAIERAKEKGAMALSEYLYAKITHDIENSPTLVAFHSADPSKIDEYISNKANWYAQQQYKELFRLLQTQPEFANLAPDLVHLSLEDQYRWTVWESLPSMLGYARRKEVILLADKIQAMPLKPEIITFLDKVLDNPIVSLLSPDNMNRYIRDHQQDPAAIAKLVQLLTNILN